MTPDVLDAARPPLKDPANRLFAALTKRPENMRPVERFAAECDLLRSDPVLALLCRIEAVADDRADNDCNAGAKLAGITELARMAIAKHTGRPFENPLFEGAK